MFSVVIKNVLIMLLYMVIGFGAAKSQKSFIKSSKGLSRVLIYILCPIMIINSFIQTEYNYDNLLNIGIFFLATLFIQLFFMLILYLVFKRKFLDPKYRVMTAGSVLGNVGFFGLPLVVSMFPDYPIVACYSSIFVVSMNLIVFTLGVFMITNEKKYISIKSAFLNPTTIAFIIALPLFLLNVDFPTWIDNGLGFFASFVTPICMLTLGIRLSTMKFKDIFTSKIAYLTCLFKLVIFPLFALLVIYFIPFVSDIFKVTLFILCAAPSGAIIVSLAELHECAREESANAVLLTTMLSIITIPILSLLIWL